MAERQPFKLWARLRLLCAEHFLFHVFINVGMVLGLTPSSASLPFSATAARRSGFTILLFIFLRIDAGRNW
jgi:rod shape determining protein RodA